ncbi:hypothetical protein ACLQ8Z_03460 [Bordetella hinzii]|uniref:Uncharacterized protein n=3 Tax=Bordetella hinzii TaxID=103855 RepID=A0AAN1RZU1_9BORD|nr:hypothetical protein [Bordetella hinzii]AKQ59705.1 hypothetical protein ACR55_01835 [Bordetella hinzii]AZW19171.1 hypothetical protein CS347_21625 [Bordetella hinzii]QDJ35861.1 hypothetical protein CBR67_03905 [Bordetella hinzii]QDJ40317.1 hypothetical protein CBR70_02910 [Bordetella hinzii]QDJ45002.1 hypothetical protein CBR71_03850 [Bordetella hinzii]
MSLDVTMRDGRIAISVLPDYRRIPTGAGYVMREPLEPSDKDYLRAINRAIAERGYACGRHADDYLEAVFDAFADEGIDLAALALGHNRGDLRQRIERRLIDLAKDAA